MDEKELQELQLEDIMKEFGSEPVEEPQQQEQPAELPEEEPEEELETFDDAAFNAWLNKEQEDQPEQPVDLEATKRMEPVVFEEIKEVTGDTIRLDGILGGIKTQEQSVPEDAEERIWNPSETIRVDTFVTDDTVRTDTFLSGDTIHNDAFSDKWEPEYEQPMGEYVPPQPIQFNPRSRLRELKKKLVAGPEKRFYELSEKGLGKLQTAIFFSLLVVLIAAASTGMYAFGLVQENRMRLLVFGQFFAMLVSALLCYNQLIQGVADLGRKHFSLNTLLVVSFLVCCVDGVLCLQQVRISCCAGFSLQAVMSLWNAYQRRSIELSQLDTMRKAIRLDGVAAYPDYLDGKKGLLRKEGQVEDFMDRYEEMGKPEKSLHLYSMIAMFIAFAVGIAAGIMGGVSAGIQVAAVSLLVAAPATAFICHSRPAWLLENRLHKLGTVLCGWQGVEGLSGNAVFPLTCGDIHPVDTMRLNGVKYFGSYEPELVASYADAVMTADNNGLMTLFHQVLDSYNGRHYDAHSLVHYENGGMSGIVEDATVLIGSASFMRDMDVAVPENIRVSYGVYVAIEGELSGLFAVNYEKTKSVTAGLTTLNSYRGLQCVLTSDDFMLTHGFLRSKFGIKPKRFILPEYEVREALRQKEPEPDAPALLMSTALGLAPFAYGVTGARALRSASRLGTVLHIVGGGIGLAIMILLVVLGALELLTPVNMFLYQLVWMIPALLITEFTRSI